MHSPLTERNSTADLLKGAAVILMIQVHLIELFATPEINQSIVGKISLFLGGPPAAPVFLVVMGFFIARSHKTLVQHIRRGALLIVGGIALNIGLNANLLYSIHQGRFQLDPLAYIFGADILPLAGLSIIVISVLQQLFSKESLAYFAAALIVASVAPLLPNLENESLLLRYLQPFFWGNQWWSYFPLLPWLAYVLVGVAFANADSLGAKVGSSLQIKSILLSSLIAALAISSPFAIRKVVELPLYYHHGTLLFVWITGFLLLWLVLFNSLENAFNNSLLFHYLKWLGRNVTSAYVFQWLIIGNIATEVYRTQGETQLVVWFVAIVAVVSLCILLFRYMKSRFNFSNAARP